MNIPARSLILLLVSVCNAIAVGSLQRSEPESEGLSSRSLLKFVEGLDSRIDGIHSVMVLRHGKVVAEGWWAPYAAESNHVLYSLSKSFTSTAVGFAVAEGKVDKQLEWQVFGSDTSAVGNQGSYAGTNSDRPAGAIAKSGRMILIP